MPLPIDGKRLKGTVFSYRTQPERYPFSYSNLRGSEYSYEYEYHFVEYECDWQLALVGESARCVLIALYYHRFASITDAKALGMIFSKSTCNKCRCLNTFKFACVAYLAVGLWVSLSHSLAPFFVTTIFGGHSSSSVCLSDVLVDRTYSNSCIGFALSSHTGELLFTEQRHWGL